MSGLSHSQFLVGLVLLIIMLELWNAHEAKHSCMYCGTYKGHRQDCPYDFESREER